MERFSEKIEPAEMAEVQLFAGLTAAEIEKALGCLSARGYFFPKDCAILRRNEEKRLLGIVLRGSVFMACTDLEGNRSILTNARQNEIFGMALLMDDFYENLSIVAAEDSHVLLIDAERLFWGCETLCDIHKRMLFNVITIFSQTNLSLMRKFRHITQHSLRRKISSFLDEQAQYQGGVDFVIPFNRQEMADYLGADRSALSAELSRMKREGLIEFEKNHFIIKRPDELFK
ncbi:MAG: Crp/Fnr family transcriptional regulator [Bacillota bacterium]|jgi:CRP-like cAMP-binding protein